MYLYHEDYLIVAGVSYECLMLMMVMMFAGQINTMSACVYLK